MKKVCFVCLGNICRSPMAEFVMKDLSGTESWLIESVQLLAGNMVIPFIMERKVFLKSITLGRYGDPEKDIWPHLFIPRLRRCGLYYRSNHTCRWRRRN